MKRLAFTASAALAATLAAAPLAAQELRIGFTSEASSADPHFHNLGPNNQLRRHVFEALVETDAAGKLAPALATSWKALDERTWEFKLRPDVKFSNGKPFSAKDVIYTFCRLGKVEGSPSSFVFAVRNVDSIATPDPLTLVLKTDSPVPLLPNNMNSVGIVSAEQMGGKPDLAYKKGDCGDIGATPKPVEFNNPAFAIGTGPYKYVEFTRGSQVVLARNDAYWGEREHWAKVTIKPLTNAGARVAALLAGDVDLVETPPIQDHERIKGAGFQIVQAISNRIIYIHLDQFTGEGWKSPGIKGTDKNPLVDKRVRQALSMAINRPGIVERIMGGVAVAAGEVLPFPLFGTTKDFPVTKFDAEAAKKLLAEAGYANGFEITLGTPNDRYINDEKIAQAIAQMWARIGVKTNIDAMTAATFFARRNKHEFSAYLAGWGADTNEISNSLNALLVTLQPEKGLGGTNRGRYSNKEFDALVVKAMATIDDKEREKLLQQASKIAMDDVGLIPLHFEVTPWAFKKGLRYQARIDQYTLATETRPVTN
jgi:peptide/nickel transport system substrate-binding protein